jgi:hypothetical protein
LTLKGVLLLASMALRRLDPAPSAPMTKDDSSVHSNGVAGVLLLLLLLLAVAAALMVLVVLAVLLLDCCCWKVSLQTCRQYTSKGAQQACVPLSKAWAAGPVMRFTRLRLTCCNTIKGI